MVWRSIPVLWELTRSLTKQTLGSVVCKELNSQLDLLMSSDKITADLILKSSKNMQCAMKLIPNVEAIPEKRIVQAIRY